MENNKKIYRATEFADKYGISRQTVYAYIATGEIPAYRIAGILFVDEAEVLERSVYNPKEA